MRVLSHRGYWKEPSEMNGATAFSRSFSLGFGTETDLRDLGGHLAISHDPPRPGAMSARELLSIHRAYDQSLPLALNIKADGLQGLLAELLEEFQTSDLFVFDMSTPDAVRWLKTDVPVYTRHSDIEPEPPLYEQAAGVWLDAFNSEWWDTSVIRKHLDAGKRVCLVSSELHGRDPSRAWDRISSSDLTKSSDFLICTDLPEEAREVFNHVH